MVLFDVVVQIRPVVSQVLTLAVRRWRLVGEYFLDGDARVFARLDEDFVGRGRQERVVVHEDSQTCGVIRGIFVLARKGTHEETQTLKKKDNFYFMIKTKINTFFRLF